MSTTKNKGQLVFPNYQPVSRFTELQQTADTACRINETTSIASTAVAALFLLPLNNDDDTQATFTYIFIGAVIGAAASLGWFLFRKKLPTRWQNRLLVRKEDDIKNPYYRCFKTSFGVGQKAGEGAAYFLFSFLTHLPGFGAGRKIFAKFIGFLIGLVCGTFGMLLFSGKPRPSPYALSIPKRERKPWLIGKDGWTKYGKAGLVFGGYVGAVIGFFLWTVFFFGGFGGGSTIGMAIGSSIGSVVGFVTIMLAVPLIHKLLPLIKKITGAIAYFCFPAKCNEKVFTFLKEVFGDYRTNHVRAGLTFGSNIGSIICAILFTFLFPGLGPLVGAPLGAAIGGIIFAVLFGVVGPILNHYFGNKHAANSPDYALRTGSLLGTNQGQALAPVPIKLIAAIAPGLCGAALGLLGMLREFFHGHLLRKKQLKENKQPEDEVGHLLPWTQRIAPGIVLGSALFGLIFALAFPPFGGFIGSAAGGLLGACVAALIEPALRWLGWLPKPNPPQKSPTSPDITESFPPPDPAAAPEPPSATHQPLSPSFASLSIEPCSSSEFPQEKNCSPSPSTDDLLRLPLNKTNLANKTNLSIDRIRKISINPHPKYSICAGR